MIKYLLQYKSCRIFNYYTDASVAETKKCVKAQKLKDKFLRAEITYDPSICPWTSDWKDLANYPLRLYFEGDIEVLVSAVSAGYAGTGPHGTVAILALFGLVGDEIEKCIYSNGPVCATIYRNGWIERRK